MIWFEKPWNLTMGFFESNGKRWQKQISWIASGPFWTLLSGSSTPRNVCQHGEARKSFDNNHLGLSR
jgi:hypothetical protein